MLTVLVLAGGASSRMGTDKAWLDLEGMPLVEHVARRLLPLAGEVLFSAGDATRFAPVIERLPLPARVVSDRYPGAGPLAGLHAGLSESRFGLTFAVATDMPFVSLPLVEWMVAQSEGYDLVVPLTPLDGETAQPEPLHALYRTSCLPAIERALDAGKRRVISFFGDVRVRGVGVEEWRRVDPDLTSFRNVNTPEEWAAARKRLFSKTGEQS